MSAWSRNLEQAVLSIDTAKLRIVGFASPEIQSGNSLFAAATAAAFARSGRPALLIDFSQPVRDDRTDSWIPGTLDTDRWVSHREQGFDQLTVRPSPSNQFLFADIKKLRSTLENLLGRYTVIILDLGPLLDDTETFLNPLAPAAACDSIVLVCRRGLLTRDRLLRAVATMRVVDIDVLGVIINDVSFAEREKKKAAKSPGRSWFRPRPAAVLRTTSTSNEMLR
jgi:Mrp family chromosome partitioning ATPase